jgi:repressor LexA
MNLTPKQLKILQLIRDSRIRRGYSPTMQELADEIGVSKVTVFEHVGGPDQEGCSGARGEQGTLFVDR